MATHTVSSAVSSSHLQITASPDDSFPSRENALPQRPASSRSTKPALPRGNATNGPVPEDELNVAAIGTGATASAGGEDAIAVAAGNFAHAKLLRGDSAEAVAAAGPFCIAESHDPFSYVAAVGNGAMALSHTAACPPVAVGFTPIAEARGPGGIAVSVGSDPMAMAGPDGYLIFVDTASKTPTSAVFKVGEFGIKPNTLYLYQSAIGFPQEVDEEDLLSDVLLPGSSRWKDLRRRAIQRDSGAIAADN